MAGLEEPGTRHHRGLTVTQQIPSFTFIITFFFSSRMLGQPPHASKVLTLNVFLNFYDYEDGLNIFNEWIKLV